MDEPFATRREFDLLRQEFTDTKHAVEELKSGNAAIAVLSSQLTGVVQAIAEIKSDMTNRFTTHDNIHKQDNDARISGRRWLIGTAIAAIGALVGLYGWIAIFIHK